MWKTLLKKYRFFVVALIAFLVLVTFFDKNSLLDNRKLRGKIRELEERRDFYLEKIRQDSLVLENLHDSAFLEQYAREHFYMKRPEETLYIVK